MIIMKNTHIEHPEDSILTGNLSALDWFTSRGDLSIKIDGAPAIVWGTNPANGKFFVGTKSVFDKVKIKINHSHEEIDKNYTGDLATILHECFDYLPEGDFILQGDFIGFGGDNTYQPNTLTYVFPEIVTQNIIIAPHTYYIADDDLRGAIAFPLTKELPSDDEVLFVTPKVELAEHLDDIEETCAFAKQIATLVEFASEREAKEIKKTINKYIREGVDIDEDEIAELHQCDINLLRLWKLVNSIKMDFFCYLTPDDSLKCIVKGIIVDHEGYVMHNEYGSFKIVDRNTFSYFNFNLSPMNQKGDG